MDSLPLSAPQEPGADSRPETKATLLRVEKDSLAEKAGFQKGDAILALAGQPLLSMADVQWVLHHTPGEGDILKATVQRGDKKVDLTLTLPKDWRGAKTFPGVCRAGDFDAWGRASCCSKSFPPLTGRS